MPAILRAMALLLALALVAAAAPPRQREPNEAYAARRAALRTQVDGPVVLFGYTGRENDSPSYVFQQEENFYYLTGHNEPGAAVVIVPEPPAGTTLDGPREMLFLPPRDPQRERWDGVRVGPDDADVTARTGFSTVLPFDRLKGELERLAKIFPRFHTLLSRGNPSGYPHAQNWQTWLARAVPGVKLASVAPALGAMRQVKMPSELKLLEKAIEVSMDAHLEAMRMMRPGIYEYEVAAKMEYVHKSAGCEGEGYAPIVGAGFNSTVLHYNELGKRVAPGDIVVLDVGAQCSGYVADITRTLPASGKLSPRQREIYEIVLAAQDAVLAALKPGMTLARTGPNSLYKIAYDTIENSAGRDRGGNRLGRYFIHGLGHHVGLNVHDAGDSARPLAPGMVVTIEPGIYIPEENLGVRIEDIVLITADGYELLTARLPRAIADIEPLMAQAGKELRHPAARAGKPSAPEDLAGSISVPPDADYRVFPARDRPDSVFVIDGETVLLVNLDQKKVSRVLVERKRFKPPRTSADLELEALPEGAVDVQLVFSQQGYGTGANTPSWKITIHHDDQTREYVFRRSQDVGLIFHAVGTDPQH